MVYRKKDVPAPEVEVIAEIGLNHNGSLDLAKKHIEMAAKSGANTVKFQTYQAAKRVPPSHPLYSVLAQCEFGERDFRCLMNTCNDWGVNFLSTAFGLDSLELLNQLGVTRVKLASFSIADAMLIHSAVSLDMSLIVSTGASTVDEILQCNEWLAAGDKSHAFLHCMSVYPVENESGLNLTNISYLRKITDRKIGFSDHSIGTEAVFYATLLGAEILEKHFTVDNSLPGPDQAMSANPAVLKALIQGVNRAKLVLGEERGTVFDEEKAILAFRTESGPEL